MPKHVVSRLDVKDYCGRWAWTHRTEEEVPFYCGSASCGRQRCRKMFYHKRVQIITCLIVEHKLQIFFTLTLDRKTVSETDAWNEVSGIWRKAQNVLKRRYCGFRFVAVLEAHKDTRYPHVHGFTNTWIKQAEWSTLWEKAGGGPVVWIEGVKGNVEEYVTKELDVARYVGKDNLLDAKSMLEAKKRSFWRSSKMKAKFELDKSEPEWVLSKRFSFKGNEDGQET